MVEYLALAAPARLKHTVIAVLRGLYLFSCPPNVDLLQGLLYLCQLGTVQLYASQALAIVAVGQLDFLLHVLHHISEISSDNLSDGLFISASTQSCEKRVDFLVGCCYFLIDSLVLFGEVSAIALDEFHGASFAELKGVIDKVHKFPAQLLVFLLELMHELANAIAHKAFHAPLLFAQFFLHAEQKALALRLGHLKVGASCFVSVLSVPWLCEISH